jgi:hypothetical protein
MSCIELGGDLMSRERGWRRALVWLCTMVAQHQPQCESSVHCAGQVRMEMVTLAREPLEIRLHVTKNLSRFMLNMKER